MRKPHLRLRYIAPIFLSTGNGCFSTPATWYVEGPRGETYRYNHAHQACNAYRLGHLYVY